MNADEPSESMAMDWAIHQDHAGDVDPDEHEGERLRDNGPYRDELQARDQFDAAVFGMPTGRDDGRGGDWRAMMVLREALMLAGVETTPYEDQVAETISGACDPQITQVIASWIIRARYGSTS